MTPQWGKKTFIFFKNVIFSDDKGAQSFGDYMGREYVGWREEQKQICYSQNDIIIYVFNVFFYNKRGRQKWNNKKIS